MMKVIEIEGSDRSRLKDFDYLEHIKTLFTTNLGILLPPFPEAFKSLLPQVNTKPLTKKKSPEETIIAGLALENRNKLIEYIINNLESITTSNSQIEHTFMIILQSFTSLYFKDLQFLDEHVLKLYIQSLIITKQILPSGSNLVFRTFYYFYIRIAASPYNIRFLNQMNQFFDAFKGFPGYFIPINIEYCYSLLRKCLDHPDLIGDDEIKTHFSIVVRELQDKVKGKMDEDFIRHLFAKITQIVYPAETIEFNEFNTLILRFAIEISRLTGVVFRELGVIINKIISTREFNDPNVVDIEKPVKRTNPAILPTYLSMQDYKSQIPDEIQTLIRFLSETPENSIPALLSSMIIDSLGFMKAPLVEILLIIFLEEPFRKPPAMEYYQSFQMFNIFFNTVLYSPEYSFFQEPIPLIVNLRHISMQVFSLLNYKINDIPMTNTIIPILINSSPYPYLFTEFLYLIRNSIDFDSINCDSMTEFLVCIKSELVMQLNLKDENYPYIVESRKILLTSLTDLAKSDRFCSYAVQSKDFLNVLSKLIFLESVQRETTVFLSSILCYAVENSIDSKILYKELSAILENIREDPERKLDVGGSILNIFHSGLACAKDDFYVNLAKSELFSAVSQYILSLTTIEKTAFTESRIPPVFVTSLLILYSLSIAMMKKILIVNWSPISDVIRKFGITEEVYSVIIMIVSVNQIEFTGINCVEAGSLVLPILESPFCGLFLKELSRCVANSYIQCINCVKAGIHSYLLDLLHNSPNEEATFLVIAILTKISSAIFDRPSLFKCIELTDPSKPTNKNIPTILSFLAGSVNDPQSTVSNFLQFTAQLGSVRLPNLPIKDFLGQVTVSATVLLTDLRSHQDTIHFLNFTSANNYLSFVLELTSVTIYSNVFPSWSLSATIDPLPLNKWINITVSFDYLSTFHFYIDGELVATIETSCNRWDEGLERTTMFHPISVLNKAMNSNVNGQVSRIYVFLTNPNEKILSSITRNDMQYVDLLSLPKINMMFSPEFSQNNTMMNLVDIESQPAVFTMYSFLDVCPIKNVFVGTKGVCLILAHLSRIDYDSPDAGNLFECYIKAISEFINCSPEVEKQMVRCNACSIIAKFMYKLKTEHLTPKLRAYFVNMERNIQNLALLNSFYQHIIIEFENWFLLDEPTVYVILKLWNDIAQNHIELFIESISFTYIFERCHYLIENNKFGHEVANEMLNLLIVSAKKTCNMQTIGLLIKLLQFTQGNQEFSLRLLHIISTLSIEVPEMQDDIQKIMVYMKEKLCHGDPLLFVTIVELFANNDTLFVDCVLDVLNMCTENDDDYIRLMVKVFCNELIAASGKEEISELVALDRFRGISIMILPFVFIISFYCDSETLPDVKEFLQKLFAHEESIRLISRGITTLGLMFAMLYTIVIDNNFLACLVRLFSHNTQLLADAFELIDIISLYSKRDCHNIQNTLASALVLIVTERRDAAEIARFVNIVSTFLIYGSDRSVFAKHQAKEMDKSFDLLHFIESFRLGLNIKRDISFGLYFTDSQWYDLNLAVLLVPLIEYVDNNSTNIARQLIIILTFMLRQDIEYAPQIIPFLDLIAARSDISVQDLRPLFLVMTKNIDIFRPATLFFSKYEQAITQNVEVYQTATNSMNILIQQLNRNSNVEKDLIKLFSTNYEAPSIPDYTLEESIEMIRRGLNARKGNLDKKWRVFWEMLEEDRTPFFNPLSHVQQYVRSDRYDAHFRPILFKKARKPLRIDVNLEKLENPDVSSLVTDSPVKFIGCCPHELWSAPCQKISVSKRSNGILYVTPTKLIFQDESRSVVIEGSSIECVFWHWTFHRADAITIFTHDYRGFIFRFPKQKDHSFTKFIKQVSMPNCFFFQENQPWIEIERLGLTQRWRNHTVSNYDYLTWLNMLSGRSFLDVCTYPIFPWLLVNETKENSSRDLSHNIAYMNKNLFAYRRKLQQEAFDPADIELFDATFSSSLKAVHYNIRIEPFTSLFMAMKFEGQNDHFTSVTKEIQDILERKTNMRIDELPPEFFFSPEFLKEGAGLPNVSLPSVAKSPEHFVYLNRKALESEVVSKRIHKWIDYVWGYKQRGSSASMSLNSVDYRLYDSIRNKFEIEPIKEADKRLLLATKGCVPRMLFTGNHPAKNQIAVTHQGDNKKKFVSIQNLESNVLAMKVCNGTTEKFRIYAIFKTGKMMCLRVGQNTFEVNLPPIAHFMGPAAKRTLVAFTESEGSPSFAFTSLNSPIVRFFDSEIHSYIVPDTTPHISPVSSLCACGKTIISGGLSGEVVQWATDEEHKFEAIAVALAHDKPISCVAASTKIGIVAALGQDGVLIVLTIPDLRFLKAQNLEIPEGAVPKSIVICDEMGYIIVFHELEGKTLVQNLTVNGTKIGKATLDGKFRAAIPYVNPQFVDIVALATSKKTIFFIDAFTLGIINNQKCETEIVDLAFHQDSYSIVASTPENNVFVIQTFVN